MITRLYIQNYAIIDNLDVRFSQNLTIITGETGAGKSIMLGALGLIMGKRADTKALYNDQEKCVVEAWFEIKAYDLKAFFDENDLDYEDQISIRREITPAGKSRAFVNDTPVNLETLQTLTAQLIEVHQQFDTLDVQRPDFQLKVIDALASNKELLKTYKEGFALYKSDVKKLDALKERNANGNKESEYLKFQWEELSLAQLKADEMDGLELELQSLTHAEEIQKACANAYQALEGEELSLGNQLTSILQTLRPITKYQPEVSALNDRLDVLLEEVKDLSSEFESIAEKTEYNPSRIEDLQVRLNLLNRLLQKHQVRTDVELIALQNELEAKLQGFDNLTGQIEEFELKISKQATDLKSKATEISKRRQQICKEFEEAVHSRLVLLAMENARLSVEINAGQDLSPTGTDQLRFLFAANKGSRMEEIKGTASGGELSRLAFCIKSLVAGAATLPTMIFDEIDAGVSGEVANRMGQMLQQLSAHHQVISITHSPLIAAKADLHFFVFKKVVGERTLTGIKILESDDRVMEIAKMLSGDPPTDAARANAKEMIIK
jgi:DNA repair protein RecN (Recombination protein N)